MAIELNDVDETPTNGDEDETVRVPLCPLTTVSEQQQPDYFRGVCLQAVFNWHQMIFGEEKEKPKCDLLFESRVPKTRSTPSPAQSATHKISTLEQCLSSAFPSPEEIGVDVVADLGGKSERVSGEIESSASENKQSIPAIQTPGEFFFFFSLQFLAVILFNDFYSIICVGVLNFKFPYPYFSSCLIHALTKTFKW